MPPNSYDLKLGKKNTVEGGTSHKKVELNIVSGDKSAAKTTLRSAESEIMSAVSKKIVHKNTAARKISRLSNKIKSLK